MQRRPSSGYYCNVGYEVTSVYFSRESFRRVHAMDPEIGLVVYYRRVWLCRSHVRDHIFPSSNVTGDVRCRPFQGRVRSCARAGRRWSTAFLLLVAHGRTFYLSSPIFVPSATLSLERTSERASE